MSRVFGVSSFAGSESTEAFYTTKSLIDAILRRTGHSNPTQETEKRLVILDALNDRYQMVAMGQHWRWLFREFEMQLTAPEESGTIAVTKGSAAVVGTGTAFVSATMLPGSKIIMGERAQLIQAIADTTHLTLDSEYSGDTDAALSYKIVRPIYATPGDCDTVQSVLIDGIGELLPIGRQELRRKQQYSPTLVGPPAFFCEHVLRDTDGVRFLEFFPNPDRLYTAKIDMGCRLVKLEDDEESYPLIPDRYRVVLLYGALADMKDYLTDAESAERAAGNFNRTLMRMQGDRQLTDSKLILRPMNRIRRRRRYGIAIDRSDFSRDG